MDLINKLKIKVNIKTVGMLFLILIIVLMFLSKTIYNHNLTKVTATAPFSGKLNKYETTSGIVDWANIEEVYSKVGATIEEILVDEGDKVIEGQPLFYLSYDEDEINNKLNEIQINKNKLNIEIENLEMKINEIKAIISNQKLSNELEKLVGQINSVEDEYSKFQILYEEGAISKNELENSKNKLDNLKNDLESLKKDYKDNLVTLEQNLKSKKLDLASLSNQEEIYKKDLSDYENNTVIVAPTDATIVSIPVKKGQTINSNQLLISFGVGNDFEIVADIILNNNFIVVGDVCELVNSSHVIEGVVTKISPKENKKQVTVTIESNEVTSGETFELVFSKESTTSFTLVPNGAVNKDNDGYFVYQIGKRKGILGDEFYVKKTPIYIGDADNENTVVTKGIDFFEPIVLLSDRSFSDGEVVKVENVGDFFAD